MQHLPSKGVHISIHIYLHLARRGQKAVYISGVSLQHARTQLSLYCIVKEAASLRETDARRKGSIHQYACLMIQIKSSSEPQQAYDMILYQRPGPSSSIDMYYSPNRIHTVIMHVPSKSNAGFPICIPFHAFMLYPPSLVTAPFGPSIRSVITH